MASHMDDSTLLSEYLTPARRARIEEVLSHRTYSLTVVFEELHDPHNIAAVLRTAEAFGIQRVHVVPEKGNGMSLSKKVTRAADKWIEVSFHKDVKECLSGLKRQGYRLLAGVLSPRARPVHDFDFTKKTAFLLGNEKNGLSDTALDLADDLYMVPMFGFVESLNVSVATGLSLYHAVQDRIRRVGRTGDLTEADKDRLRTEWYKLSVKAADAILRRIKPENA